MPAKRAFAIRARLHEFVKGEYGTPYELVEAEGVSRSTAAAWFGKHAAVPDVLSLEPLIRRGLSLDWLFTGEGYPRRLPRATDAAAEFDAVVLAHLPGPEPTTRRRHRLVTSLLRQYGGGPGGIARFAHAAIRGQFDALMESLRVYDEFRRWGDADDLRDAAAEAAVGNLVAVVRAAGIGDQLPTFDVDKLAADRWQRWRSRRRRIREFFLGRLPKDPPDPATRVFREYLLETAAFDDDDPIVPPPTAVQGDEGAPS